MEHELKMGTILIQDHAVTPTGIVLESEPYIAGWRLVSNFDRDALERATQKAGWSFLCRAKEITLSVLGADMEKAVRTVVERIVAIPRPEKFNALEITRVSLTESERFPHVHYVTVSGRLRNIQQSVLPFGTTKPLEFRAEKGGTRDTSRIPSPKGMNGTSAEPISIVRRAKGLLSMKEARKVVLCFAVGLLSVPAIRAQDLSQYRAFSLRTSVATVSKQTGASASAVKLIYKKPALIQELTWWPIEGDEQGAKQDSVQEIRFSFCDDRLYKMAAIYDGTAIEGLTADDIVNAISAKYGVATRPAPDSEALEGLSFSSSDALVAVWEDPQYSATLSRSPLSQTYQLIVLSKALASTADSDIAASVKEQAANAPQMELDREKKAADDLQTKRQENVKSFRP